MGFLARGSRWETRWRYTGYRVSTSDRNERMKGVGKGV